MTVNEFAKEVHENAAAHGWWETARSFPEVAALIHSEVSEALEEWRDGNPAIYGCCGIPGAVCEFEGACDKDEKTGTCKPEGVAVELCDAIIRILDYLDKRLPLAAKGSHAGVIDHPWSLICHRERIDVHDHLEDVNASSAKNVS